MMGMLHRKMPDDLIYRTMFRVSPLKSSMTAQQYYTTSLSYLMSLLTLRTDGTHVHKRATNKRRANSMLPYNLHYVCTLQKYLYRYYSRMLARYNSYTYCANQPASTLVDCSNHNLHWNMSVRIVLRTCLPFCVLRISVCLPAPINRNAVVDLAHVAVVAGWQSVLGLTIRRV
jgi:hypothetical protein